MYFLLNKILKWCFRFVASRIFFHNNIYKISSSVSISPLLQRSRLTCILLLCYIVVTKCNIFIALHIRENVPYSSHFNIKIYKKFSKQRAYNTAHEICAYFSSIFLSWNIFRLLDYGKQNSQKKRFSRNHIGQLL